MITIRTMTGHRWASGTIAVFVVLGCAASLTAQDAQHQPPQAATDSMPAAMPGMSAGDAQGQARDRSGDAAMPGMDMRPGPLGIPMTRQGSGTSWLPDAAAMHAEHAQAGGGAWEFMVHGSEFVQYDRQVGGDRGATQFGAVGWVMGMATHAVGAGRISLRGMFSADPWTVTERGYPLILQTGEAYNGEPLHDRQHPHDLFMELAGVYETPIARALAVQLYVAPVGEPALGPVAFPHRSSAQSDPFAPLSHHWQDATHISFGVLTAGLFTHDVKLEASIFNGREPDQHRADFDYTEHSPVLDSYAVRLTANPAADWSISTWYSYLASPEELEPAVSQHRLGASLQDVHAVGARGEWSSAVIYGANLYSNDRRLSNSALVETNLDVDGTNTVFGRIEYVDRSPADLAVAPPPPPAALRFAIGSLGIGYLREIGPFTHYGAAAIGAVVTMDVIPSSLEPAYRTRTPGGFAIFLRVRPAHQHRNHVQMESTSMMANTRGW